MKNQKTDYQRVQLDGTWYVIIREDEFRVLTEPRGPGKRDALEALSISDQRLTERLLRRRQEAGLTQKDLARLAGIRVETLNRVEKGRTTPDFRTVRKLVNAMNGYSEKKQEIKHVNANE